MVGTVFVARTDGVVDAYHDRLPDGPPEFLAGAPEGLTLQEAARWGLERASRVLARFEDEGYHLVVDGPAPDELPDDVVGVLHVDDLPPAPDGPTSTDTPYASQSWVLPLHPDRQGFATPGQALDELTRLGGDAAGPLLAGTPSPDEADDGEQRFTIVDTQGARVGWVVVAELDQGWVLHAWGLE